MKRLIICMGAVFSFVLANAQKDADPASFTEDFNDAGLHHFRYGSRGTETDFKYKTGVASQSENGTRVLSFKIDPADSAGAGRGPEIISNDFTHFGTYSARLKVPDVRNVQPNVGAVVGYFTYHMDKVEGLSEIDFEWLIADPRIIYIGTWTGHGELKRIGRTINLADGTIFNTIYKEGHNGQPTALTGPQNQPETIRAIKGYNAASEFYTYGFDWYADSLRWWILHPVTGEKIVLWNYSGSRVGIPQNETHYRMNFWHTNNWSVQTNPNSLEKPKQPYELEVDWMKYKPFGQ